MILLRRRLFILLPFFAVQLRADVTWDSPADGDIYHPGDTLQAVWISQETVASPSFTICAGSGGNNTNSDNPDCGTAVWPSVEQNGTEYSISLAIPNITGDGAYYLVMKDNSGTKYETPNFALQLPTDANSTTSSNPTQPATTDLNSVVPSHSSSATIAIAIPLSLVGAILLGALALLLFRARRFRRLEGERYKQLQESREAESKSRLSTTSFATATDVERAVWALSVSRANGFGNYQASQANSFVGAGLGATSTSIGRGVSDHGHDSAPSTSLLTDGYTPAPIRRHISTSTASSSPAYSTHAYRGHQPYYESAHDQRESLGYSGSADGTLVERPGSTSQFSHYSVPQLPAIQLHANLPLVHPDTPPPLPPKHLVPGRPNIHVPRAYTPPFRVSAMSSPGPYKLRAPGSDSSSLHLISNYMQPSPEPSYSENLEVHVPEMLAPRVPPLSMIRERSLRRLEILQEREDSEKPLPVLPEDRLLGGAMSRAVWDR